MPALIGVDISSPAFLAGLFSCRKGVGALTGVAGKIGTAGVIADGARLRPARDAGREGVGEEGCSLAVDGGTTGAWNPGGIVGVALRGATGSWLAADTAWPSPSSPGGTGGVARLGVSSANDGVTRPSPRVPASDRIPSSPK